LKVPTLVRMPIVKGRQDKMGFLMEKLGTRTDVEIDWLGMQPD
jgi:hypothetical protein